MRLRGRPRRITTLRKPSHWKLLRFSPRGMFLSMMKPMMAHLVQVSASHRELFMKRTPNLSISCLTCIVHPLSIAHTHAPTFNPRSSNIRLLSPKTEPRSSPTLLPKDCTRMQNSECRTSNDNHNPIQHHKLNLTIRQLAAEATRQLDAAEDSADEQTCCCYSQCLKQSVMEFRYQGIIRTS